MSVWAIIALGLLAGYAVGMLVILTRPKATFVGHPPSPFTIAARAMAKSMRDLGLALGVNMLPAIRAATEAMQDFHRRIGNVRGD